MPAPSNAHPYEHAQGLTPEQAKALLKACDRASVKGLRDYALLAFYLYTGRRRSEIAQLCWQDLRAGSEAGKLDYHYTGKGHKSSWREIPPPVWSALQSYLKAAGRLETMRPDSPLFVAPQHQSAEERPLAPITINQIVHRAASLAGLEHIKVHSLRHTAAKLRRRSGADLEDVSQFLDHSSIATTQIYINSLEAVKDVSWQGVEALIGAKSIELITFCIILE
ncbi:MAG: tyrosine-type recombinase/integrase [Chloroflexi bacterium]|uniref:Tyrosine-type recombinase/integrase n=1 Tax=Candidatus Chlorohelix allophototropha TaxID=3003348 RepID=A0A8T7MAW3_9CHLR|nr:tyrosine-type recombinase/integrase [Chloroflexota bacterium]